MAKGKIDVLSDENLQKLKSYRPDLYERIKRFQSSAARTRPVAAVGKPKKTSK